MAPRHHREAVRHRPGERARAQRARPPALRRRAGLPHRPLPRQGDRPEPAGVPVRQRDVRADLEPPLHRSRADHRGRDGRRRAARGVLRGRRRAARHGAEPHDAAPRAGGDGAADRVHRRERARSQDGRAACRCSRSSRTATARDSASVVRAQYASGWVAGAPVEAYRREPDVAPGIDDRDVRGAEAAARQLALGRRAVLHPHRQAAAEADDRDRDPVPASAARRSSSGSARRRWRRTC